MPVSKKPKRRPERDKKKNPVVALHPTQTQVGMSDETELLAIMAAYNATMSPHEWTWSQKEQVAMAQYVLYACQRLAAIEQLTTNKRLNHADAELVYVTVEE